MRFLGFLVVLGLELAWFWLEFWAGNVPDLTSTPDHCTDLAVPAIQRIYIKPKYRTRIPFLSIHNILQFWTNYIFFPAYLHVIVGVHRKIVFFAFLEDHPTIVEANPLSNLFALNRMKTTMSPSQLEHSKFYKTCLQEWERCPSSTFETLHASLCTFFQEIKDYLWSSRISDYVGSIGSSTLKLRTLLEGRIWKCWNWGTWS